jgi:hypothetical protein
MFSICSRCIPRTAAYRDRHERGVSGGGRGQCRACKGLQGGLVSVSDRPARETNDAGADGKIVWSWRPEGWRQVSSRGGFFGSTGSDKTCDLRGATEATEHDLSGEHVISRKPLRAGRRVNPVYPTPPARLLPWRTSLSGASNTWRSPRPVFQRAANSWQGSFLARLVPGKARALRAARPIDRVWPSCVRGRQWREQRSDSAALPCRP